MSTSFLLLAVVLLAGFLAVTLLFASGAPLGRERVERFTVRHGLKLTEANGTLVVRALAVTHRWRRFGLAAGFALAALWALREGRLEFNFVAMFLGWFAGALVAEWRTHPPAPAGARRTADLTPRTWATYVTRPARALLWGVLGLLAVAALAAAWAAAGLPDAWPGWVGGALQVLAGGAALLAVTRRVVGRPRAQGDAALLAADDALRAHSLGILAGSAIALASVPLGTFVDLLVRRAEQPEMGALLGFAILLAGIVLGWSVAQNPARPARVPVAP